MGEWQPIETAPRDGTRILVWNAVTGPYSTEYIGLLESPDGEWPLLLWGGMTGRWYPRPTHWQPLPAPPEVPRA